MWEISLHLSFINCMLPDMLCSVGIWGVYVICTCWWAFSCVCSVCVCVCVCVHCQDSRKHIQNTKCLPVRLIGQFVAWPYFTLVQSSLDYFPTVCTGRSRAHELNRLVHCNTIFQNHPVLFHLYRMLQYIVRCYIKSPWWPMNKVVMYSRLISDCVYDNIINSLTSCTV